MKIKGGELKAFMEEAWPGEEGEWYLDCDDEVFDGNPDSLVAGKVYDTDEFGHLHYGGCGEDPSKGDGIGMDTLIRRWRKARTYTPVTISVPNEKLEEFRIMLKTLGLKEKVDDLDEEGLPSLAKMRRCKLGRPHWYGEGDHRIYRKMGISDGEAS